MSEAAKKQNRLDGDVPPGDLVLSIHFYCLTLNRSGSANVVNKCPILLDKTGSLISCVQELVSLVAAGLFKILINRLDIVGLVRLSDLVL